MSDHALLVTVFWALTLIDGAWVGRRARFSFVSWLGGRHAWPVLRRWHGLSPWPGGWRVMADDLPVAFSPAGLCNWPAGSAARPAATPAVVQAWRWEEIASVSEEAGQLVVNGRPFCAATPLFTASDLLALAGACAPLSPEARAILLRVRLRLWLRPAHLRRRATVLRARTAGLVLGNGLTLAGTVLISLSFLSRLPESGAVTLPEFAVGLLGLHCLSVGLAWWERRHLVRFIRETPPPPSPLLGVLLYPPGALRLRALLGASWFPPSHPVAVALAVAPPAARDELVFNALADLRWPLAPAGGEPLAEEILTWYRRTLGEELEVLLKRESVDIARLFVPPEPDGAASCAYCPRCRAQFVVAGGSCPQGVALRPLK